MLFIKSVIASSQGKTWGCFSQFCLGRSRPHRGISEYWTTQCQDWQDGADVEICHSSLSNHNLYYWTCNLSSGSLSTTNSTLIKTMSIEYHCHSWYHHHQGIQICFIQHCWKMQSFIKKLKLKKRREPIKSQDDQTKLQGVGGKGVLSSLLGSAHMPLWLIRQVLSIESFH